MAFNFIKKFFKAIYLIPYGIRVSISYTQSGNLIADGKFQQALDKIIWLDNKESRGEIGLRKAAIYAFLKQYQIAIDINNEIITYLEQSEYYNEYDKTYLLFTAKMDVFRSYRDMNIKQPELFNELSHMMETLELSKIDKRLMNDFPERSLKGWYKHNPKDEYYEQTIARYGEE